MPDNEHERQHPEPAPSVATEMHEERFTVEGKDVVLREQADMAELEVAGTRVHLGKSRGRYSTHLFPFVNFGSAREAADLIVGTHGRLWGPPEPER